MSGYTPYKMKGPSLYRSPVKQQDAAEKKMESQLFDGDKDENKLDGDKTSTQNKHTSTPSESKEKTRTSPALQRETIDVDKELRKQVKDYKGKKTLKKGQKKVDYIQHTTGLRKNPTGEKIEAKRKKYLESLNK